MSSNHHLNAKPNVKSNSLGRPHSAESKSKSRGSPIMKLAAIFRRERNTENGRVPVRPSCFADDEYDRRSDSPEPHSPSKRNRTNSNGNRSHFKLWKNSKDGSPGSFQPWRSKVNS